MSKYQNYVPQPLAFYKEFLEDDRRYQNYKQAQCAGDLSTWTLVIVADMADPVIQVPAFQIKTDYDPVSVSSFRLRSVDGTVNIPLDDSGFTIESLGTDLYCILFDGTSDITLAIDTIEPKQYYFTVADVGNTYYSEVFEFQQQSTENTRFPQTCGGVDWMKLRWSNPGCIISETIFNAGTFHLFIAGGLGQPDYVYKPETEDDGQGGKINVFQRLDKKWEFFIVAPEYVADALTAVQMFSDVQIAFVGDDFLQCRDIEVSTDWQTSCLVKITFRFSADFLAKTACCQ